MTRVTPRALRVRPYVLPLVAPLETARGAVRERRGWLIEVEDARGQRGWGDVAPWAGLGTDPAIVGAELEDLAAVDGLRPFADVGEIEAAVRALATNPEVAYGLELAFLDLLGHSSDRSLASLLWPSPRSEIASHALVTGHIDPRWRWLKIKVGARTLDSDLERLLAIRARCHPQARLRLDVAGGWSLSLALGALESLADVGVVLLEQPLACGALEELAQLRREAAKHGIAIAVDEAVRSAADLDAHLDAGAIDAVVLKPMFLGGLLATRALAERALCRGCRVIVTSALESAVGRTGALHLAAGIEGVHGLGPLLGPFLAADLARPPSAENGTAVVPCTPGLGVEPARLLLDPLPARHVGRRSDRSPDALPNPVASAALARPDHPALLARGFAMGYRELVDQVARRARSLHDRGIGATTVVGLDGQPTPSWVLAFHALGWIGAVAAPLAPAAKDSERERELQLLGVEQVVDPDELDVAAEPLGERFGSPAEERVRIATSGSDGAAKAVALTTMQLLLSAFGSAIRLGLHPADRWLCCLPLHHVGGLSILTRSAFYGTTVLLHERFDPARVNADIDEGQVTLVSLVPTMLERLLDDRSEPGGATRPFPASLRALLVGGAATSEALLARCAASAAPLALTWGMTEAASQVATCSVGELTSAAGVGAPLAFARVDRVGDRLRVRGPLVRGEHLSGDLGHVDDGGRVHVSGRADEVIVSGGEKIAPAQIEAALSAHPAVAAAAVVGMPSARWGARPAAALEATGPVQPSDEALVRWCRERLSAFKVPDAFCWWPSLPRTSLGKIRREKVRDRLATELGHGSAVVRANEHSVGEHAPLPQPVEQPCRRSARLETGAYDEGVDQSRAGPQLAVLSANGVGESDRFPPDARDGELHQQAVVLAHGLTEVSLGVHQRHADVVLGEQPTDAVTELDEQLLVGLVAHLEHAAEEQDAGGIHLKEARGDAMNEGHDDDRR